jgi:hypothetical protein
LPGCAHPSLAHTHRLADLEALELPRGTLDVAGSHSV